MCLLRHRRIPPPSALVAPETADRSGVRDSLSERTVNLDLVFARLNTSLRVVRQALGVDEVYDCAVLLARNEGEREQVIGHPEDGS